MNICYTMTAYLPYIGGAQIHIHSIAQRLLGLGCSPRALAFWDRNRADWLLGTTVRAPLSPKPYMLDGVPVDRIPVGAATRAWMLPWALSYYAAKPAAIPALACAIAPTVRRATANADIVHNVRIGREPLTLASLWAARAHDVPFCMTSLHHPKWNSAYDLPYHLLYRAADAVLALTAAEREMLVRLGVRPERITVIGHGPEVAATAEPQAFRERHVIDGPLVLFVGEKRAYKGFQQLVAAAPLVWRRYPDVRFVFIGPRTQTSRAFFSTVNDPRILELGTVSLQEKTDALAACDMLVLPSTQESFGGVFAEAWVFGKPVIGCDIPAVRDVIDEQTNGVLVQQEANDIAEKIGYLLEQPAECARLGRNGQQKVEREYAWDVIARKTLTVYKQLIGRASQ